MSGAGLAVLGGAEPWERRQPPAAPSLSSGRPWGLLPAAPGAPTRLRRSPRAGKPGPGAGPRADAELRRASASPGGLCGLFLARGGGGCGPAPSPCVEDTPGGSALQRDGSRRRGPLGAGPGSRGRRGPAGGQRASSAAWPRPPGAGPLLWGRLGFGETVPPSGRGFLAARAAAVRLRRSPRAGRPAAARVALTPVSFSPRGGRCRP